MSRVRRLLSQPEIWLLLALTLPAVLPLTAPAYFFGAHDARHSVFFLVEFDQAIRDGAWWPRWAPDQALGFGYPLWVLYAPLTYYAAEFFHLLGAGFTTAVKLTWALATFVAAVSMYALVRRWWGQNAGLVAGLLYAYAPYHLLNMTVRAALAEYAALSLLPLVLLAFWNLIERGDLRRLALAALAYAALLLTHNVTAFMFTPLLGAFVILAVFQVASRRSQVAGRKAHGTGGTHHAPRITHHASRITHHASRITHHVSRITFYVLRFSLISGAVLLALGLSSIFLLPMLLERQYIVQEQWVRATYQYRQHFVYLHQFLSPFWGYGYAVEGPNDGMSFQLGLLPIVLALAGTLAALRRGAHQRGVALFFAGATAIVLWLMTASSQAVWRLLPLAALIQFPWRLLSLTSLTLAILAGPAVAHAPRTTQHTTRITHHASRNILHPAPCILALLIVFASFPYTQPQYTEVTPRHESPLAVIDFELEYPDMRGMTAWASRMPQPEDAPLVAQYLAGEPLTKAHLVQGEGEVQTLRHGGTSEELLVASPGGGRVQVYTYWFPGWQVRVDGRLVESWPEGPNGLITFDVPAGEHHVQVRMTESTPPRRIGGILSGISLLATLVLCSVEKRRGRISRRPKSDPGT
ncbi:MAG: 6-pyruvoyl-tetrahydropterin synthase-related protein [Anaerolineae bacterium]|nr:6-pyruvoyl-tetrahydropterin synthase-related protein [Anaerolineae bacterium]